MIFYNKLICFRTFSILYTEYNYLIGEINCEKVCSMISLCLIFHTNFVAIEMDPTEIVSGKHCNLIDFCGQFICVDL